MACEVSANANANGYGAIHDQSPPRLSDDAPLRRDHERGGASWARRWVMGAIVGGTALGAFMAATTSGSSPSADMSRAGTRLVEVASSQTKSSFPTSPRVQTAPGAASQEPLSFTALNYYHIRDGSPGQDYPWLKNMKVLEPYRETTMTVINPVEGHQYEWEIAPSGEVGNTAVVTASGVEAVVLVESLEENVVTLKERDSSGSLTRQLDETVMVKYVRREIRALTESEREELLDAMFTLWDTKVDGGNGKQIYGDEYADIWAINRLHFKAATVDRCDHFHDGLGFLVSHSLITNTFEHSLQLVNPKLTVPYWDFTIEASTSAKEQYDPADPNTRTPLLDPSWFGTYDPVDNIVKDGRWAYMKMPSAVEGNPSDLHTDIYGRLRSPWNTNDRPYISRGMGQMCGLSMDDVTGWPTCYYHYDLVNNYEVFYYWVWMSMGNPHAPVHFWLGGILDCEENFIEIGELVGTDIANTLAFLANSYRKDLYCDGVWGCGGRTVDPHMRASEALNDGVCGCEGYNLEEGDDYLIVMEHFDYLDHFIGGFDADTQRKVVSHLCNGVLSYGEHGQSSSPMDPSFWPTHPTMERLWQFSVLTESVTDFDWPDEDITVTLPDGSSYEQVTSSYYSSCFGHRGSDVFPFGLLDNDQDDFQISTGVKGQPVGNTLTNREILASFDPRQNSMNYIYDTFKWDHCTLDGYNFDDAWANKNKDSTSKKEIDYRMFETTRPIDRMYTELKREMADLKDKGLY